MDFIALYQSLNPISTLNAPLFNGKQQRHYPQQAIYKFIGTMQRFKNLSFTLLSPQLSRSNRIIANYDKISFCVVYDSKIPQFNYFFNVQINLHQNVMKIFTTVVKEGRPYKVHKEGIVQLLCHYFLNINSVSNYSLKIHPFTGIIKFGYVNHFSHEKFNQLFIFPVESYENIKKIITQMAERLDQRILGKILHFSNQIQLKDIIPQSFDTNLSQQNIQTIKKLSSTHPLFPQATMIFHWGINKKLKQIRKYIINSTIKYPFISKDHQNDLQRIRFVPEIGSRRRELQKQQKMSKHNIKIIPFSKEIKDILKYYTPLGRFNYEEPYGFIDNSWFEPTEEQIKNMRQILKCDFVKGRQRTLNIINIQSIESQIPLCSGGFADISRLLVKTVKKPQSQQNPQLKNSKVSENYNKLYLIKKCAGKEKLFWQKQIINHIGKGSCIFINKYYEPKIDRNSIGLTQKMFEDSILMQYCPQRSLNHYLAKMSSVISIRSKLFILYQISIALRFLRDHGVTHLDVKPQNVLIKMATSANNISLVIVKIIDYGQAYCQVLIGSKINRGHTCPYAPPQLVIKHSEAKFTQKSDVFSLGVMILIIIFQLNTVDIKRMTSSAIFETNQRYIRFYSMCMQKCRYLYYQPLIQCLMNLAYKCISPNPSSRPYLNWICVILRTMLSTFDQLQKTKY